MYVHDNLFKDQNYFPVNAVNADTAIFFLCTFRSYWYTKEEHPLRGFNFNKRIHSKDRKRAWYQIFLRPGMVHEYGSYGSRIEKQGNYQYNQRIL